MRKDAINASALCLYRKPEAARPERPLFMEAPLSEAPDDVRRSCSMQRLICAPMAWVQTCVCLGCVMTRPEAATPAREGDCFWASSPGKSLCVAQHRRWCSEFL